MLVVLGVNVWDWVVVLGFLIATLGLGIWVSRSVKDEHGFYLSGRKMGRWLQFFLSFGNASDPTGATQTSSEVFRQGVGGVWMSLQVLFITPFFWFTQVWFRRSRVVTMADLFIERFNSKTIAVMYALFNCCIAFLWLSAGNLAVYKVVSAMIVKPESAYTEMDRREIADFKDYQNLAALRAQGTLPADQASHFDELQSRVTNNQLHAFITYIPNRTVFYIIYSIVVASYVMLGGLRAAAVSDAVQGVLILLMSFIMVPMGLYYLGGFKQLHDKVPAFQFALVGTSAQSDYAWYTILAIIFGSFIQILGLSHNMSIGGSARNENTARFGMISGGFAKRFVIIAWMFCGLLATAILVGPSAISDPDSTWGSLSNVLFKDLPGLGGLMMAGMLLGHMPFVGTQSVSVSALLTRNLYEPFFPGKDPKHYLRFGQLMIPVVLGITILVGMVAGTGVVQLYAKVITFNIYFGAVVLLIFFWRRLTPTAIIIGCIVWVILFGVIPFVVPQIKELRQNQTLAARTTSIMITVKQPATEQDVASGAAKHVGEPVPKTVPSTPKAVFFEKAALIPGSTDKYEGVGQFYPERYILWRLGVPLEKLSPAAIEAMRWAFDGIFPFVMLIALSLVTKPIKRERDDFYVRLKTPIALTPEEDRLAVEKNVADPERMEQMKIFPGSNWEFGRWSKQDYLGFGACWLIVGVIVLFLYAVVTVGS